MPDAHRPASFPPPYTDPDHIDAALAHRGYAVLAPDAVCRWAGCDTSALAAQRPAWDDLPPDGHLKDGGAYRFRRHASCTVGRGGVQPVAHRAHWQPVEYNALHGGMERWFAPVQPATQDAPAWRALLGALGRAASVLRGSEGPWYVEAHQFRIDTANGIGRPTPEGAHRDGVDLVAVFLVAREGVKGGETRVFAADGPDGQRFTLDEPWSLLLLDDARVIHETTPIQPQDAGAPGWRDTLVLTARARSFQGAM